ncbi:hypothetical protein [Jeotgalibacillus salarius]|uniref:Uncharacterized protein n=1 Tax=Jeotgalibacillus salarius TaxID=546023 RepID=A0A4Y8LHM3_9BACL|nr:hypothetical protein [Jeotgalibacillus salarius]TFE02320.1 hypothetical protein E2626_07005 [Jeotgalibacillus salarius]
MNKVLWLILYVAVPVFIGLFVIPAILGWMGVSTSDLFSQFFDEIGFLAAFIFTAFFTVLTVLWIKSIYKKYNMQFRDD